MRTNRRSILATLTALAFGASLAGPALAQAAPIPAVRVALSSVGCNPGGVAGLRATGSSTVTNATVRSAQLVIFEFQAISDPAYAPFTWTGGSVATWISETTTKVTSTTDSRTLATTDQATWNRGNYSKGIWFGSKSDSWWFVVYTVSASTRSGGYEASVRWYVSCPTGRVVDAAGLLPIEQAPMPRLP